MLVQVKWINDRFDFVEDFMLGVWLDAEAIAEFHRSSGWVRVGKDPVRTNTRHCEYDGRERRIIGSRFTPYVMFPHKSEILTV